MGMDNARTSQRLCVENVGQITKADVAFGDLTVLVGPQATGKSIFLQFLKLLVDPGHVLAELKKYGLDWEKKVTTFLDIYLGEGMNAAWHARSSRVASNGQQVDLAQLVGRQRRAKGESLFFIPAQRVLTLVREGWPRPFSDYSSGDPFAVREFSEKLRLLMEEFARQPLLFPQAKRLKREYRTLLDRAVFSGFGLRVDRSRPQKRLVLAHEGGADLPYMVWSAGQREFVPLLLGFYWLLPPTRVSRRRDIDWVVIEELEMGMHPRAISVIVLMVFDLLQRGYRVCLSTHSAQVLEGVWVLKLLGEHGASPDTLLRAFDAPSTPAMRRLASTVLAKKLKVFYFDPKSRVAHDISDLDPDAEEVGESGWGGLSEFSGRANRAVAQAVANAERELAS
jgi:hypothetical protein